MLLMPLLNKIRNKTLFKKITILFSSNNCNKSKHSDLLQFQNRNNNKKLKILHQPLNNQQNYNKNN